MTAISPLWRREVASFDDNRLWSHAKRGSPPYWSPCDVTVILRRS
jgi:hypothetical protein